MWPDVLDAIRAELQRRFTEAGESVPVYLGASAGVPQVDQVNIVRGRSVRGTSVSCKDNSLVVYIEVWANPEREPEGDSDVEYENSRTLPGYERLAALTKIILADDLYGSDPVYRSQYVETLPDNDAFRPVCASRLEFKVTMR